MLKQHLIDRLPTVTKEDLSLCITYLKYSFSNLTHILYNPQPESGELLVIVEGLEQESRERLRMIRNTVHYFLHNGFLTTVFKVAIVDANTFLLCMDLENNSIYNAAIEGMMVYDAELERDLLWEGSIRQ